MNWMIPNTDPYVTYLWQEILRWSGENLLTLIIIMNILALLQVYAYKTPSVRDDKIITLLIYFFSFKWVSKLTTPIGTEEKPYPLKEKDVVK